MKTNLLSIFMYYICFNQILAATCLYFKNKSVGIVGAFYNMQLWKSLSRLNPYVLKS